MFAEWLMSHFVYKMAGVSDPTSRDLIKYEKISPRKIVTVLNGIDKSIFDIAIDKEKKKRELNIVRKGPVIGLGARLSRWASPFCFAPCRDHQAHPDCTDRRKRRL
jgi:hypothetical protein